MPRLLERRGARAERAVVAQQHAGIDPAVVRRRLSRRCRGREGPVGRDLPAGHDAAVPDGQVGLLRAGPVVAPRCGQFARKAQARGAERGGGLHVGTDVSEAGIAVCRLRCDARQRAFKVAQQARDAPFEAERPAAAGLHVPGGVVVHVQQTDIELLPLRGAFAHDIQLLRLREPQHVRGDGHRVASRAADVVQIVLHAEGGRRTLLPVGIGARDEGAEVAPDKVGREPLAQVDPLGVGLQPHLRRDLAVAQPGLLAELLDAFAVAQVADRAGRVVRLRAVGGAGDVGVQLVVVGEFPEVVRAGRERAVHPRAPVVERRFGEPRREPLGRRVAVGATVEQVVDAQLPQIGRRVAARVLALDVVHRLAARRDAHGEGRAVPEHLVGRGARRSAQRAGPVCPGLLFQAEVQRRTVAVDHVAQGLDRLVVLHHLDARHILRGDVVRRQSIAAVEHVQSVDVEAVDRLAVVADFARLFDLDAGHLAQHIGDRAVLRLGEARDVVAYRVAPQRKARRADLDLADGQRRSRHGDFERCGGRDRLPAVAHRRDLDAGDVPPRTRPEAVGAVGSRGRVARLAARAVGRQHDGSGDGTSVGGIHDTARQLLRRCGCGKSQQDNEKCNPLHATLRVIRVRSGCSRARGRPD